MSLKSTLKEVFNTNFVSYTQAHIAHLNIVGRNFYSDHKLLNHIYDALQADIDTIGEFIRTLNDMAPESLEEIRQNALATFGSQNRAVTEKDYDFWVVAFHGHVF